MKTQIQCIMVLAILVYVYNLTYVYTTISVVSPAVDTVPTIPSRVVFNHKTKLVHFTNDSWTITRTASVRDTRLAENVLHTIGVMGIHDVTFMDDAECLQLMPWYLKGIYAREKVGMYRSDLCRLAQLHKYGGWYFDTDIGVLSHPLTYIDPNVTLVSVLATDIAAKSLFQAFLAVSPNHPLITRTMRAYVEVYMSGKASKVANLGTVVLWDTFLSWSGYNAQNVVDMVKKGQTIRHNGGHASFLLKEEAIRLTSNNVTASWNDNERCITSHLKSRGKMCDFTVFHPRTKRVVFLSRVYAKHQACLRWGKTCTY